MIQIQKALKRIIERFVIGKVSLSAAATAGDTTLTLSSTRRFECGDIIAVYDDYGAENNIEAEWAEITGIPDKNTIELSAGLQASYTSTYGTVQKLIGYGETATQTILDAVYLGSPNVIQRFPAITIDAKSRTSQWLTLESTQETFDIDIGVFVQAADYEAQYELMHAYTKKIESSLFRSFYPLVEPYETTTLAEDAAPNDLTIKITNQTMLQCRLGWFWLENEDFLRSNRALEYLGNGVYRMAIPAGRSFAAGDTVILPRRHIFNSLPAQTRSGVTNTAQGMLQGSVISYTCTEEVRRFVPFIDPLTF